MIEHIPDLVNGDPVLVRRGRHLTTTFLVGVGDDDYLIRIFEGRIATLEMGPFVMRPWSFAIRAAAETWEKFWQPVPEPGYHDIFALLRKDRISLDGDIRLLMAHLLYIKLLLAAPRRWEGAR